MKEEIKHESFGKLRFSRVSCTPAQRFYGSELAQSHYIQMTLEESEVHRTLTQESYFCSGKTLVQLRMSTGQFAELITSLNTGSGTPVTIELVGEKFMEKLPEIESRKEFVHNAFTERMKSFGDTIRKVQEDAKNIVKKKTLSKEDIRNLTHHLDWLTGEVERNIPFFAEQFQETMDKVVLEAKTEVENAIQHKISVLGLEELHKQQGNLLIDGNTK